MPVAPAYRAPPSYSSHWDRPERTTDAWGDDDNLGQSRGEWNYAIDEQGREQAIGPTPFKSYALLIATSWAA